jgi:lincosamide nucleotidyltransferase A/C/D/E
MIESTMMKAQTVLALYNSLEKLGVKIWLDGGWGVDALLEKQTREHNDLDIVIQEKNVGQLLDLLERNGYKEIKLEIARPHNFVLADEQGNEVDTHVIVPDDKGDGIYGPVANGEMYPAASLTGIGSINGQSVRCISAEWSLKFHSGYKLKDKDLRDMSALCEKFNLELPQEYKNFQQE